MTDSSTACLASSLPAGEPAPICLLRVLCDFLNIETPEAGCLRVSSDHNSFGSSVILLSSSSCLCGSCIRTKFLSRSTSSTSFAAPKTARCSAVHDEIFIRSPSEIQDSCWSPRTSRSRLDPHFPSALEKHRLGFRAPSDRGPWPQKTQDSQRNVSATEYPACSEVLAAQSTEGWTSSIHCYAPQGHQQRWLRAVLALARDQVVSADFMNLHFIHSVLLLHISYLSSYSYASVTLGVAVGAAAAVAAAAASIKAHPFTCRVRASFSGTSFRNAECSSV